MSDIHQQIAQQFPSDPIDHGQVGRLIMKAFPNAQSKRIGEEKTFIVGIELCATLQPTSESPEALLQVEKARSEQLSLQVQMLEARVRELEQRPLQHTYNPLLKQVEAVFREGQNVLHGPDTPTRFDNFSLAAVTDELRTFAPDLFSLLNRLAKSQRNEASEEVTVEQRKVVMSLCTLLNARSQRVKGLQLLISFMLVARATSKQVSKTQI